MMRAAAFAPLLIVLACGGGGGLPTDAAAGDGAAGSGGQVPVSCETATQAGCAAEQQCNAFCDGLRLVVACRAEPAGGAAIGQPCMNVQCARGGVCVATAGKDARCVKFCSTSADCPAGQACRTVQTTYGCASAGPATVALQACL